jgi:hypothetical protein
MKQLLFVLALLLGAGSTYAQKNFEGKIIYLLEADKEEKKPQLTVFFSAGKVKLVFKEGEDPDNKYVVVVPDSGKVFTINTSTKEYKQKKLNVAEPAGTYTPQKKTIAGYATTSAKGNESGLDGLLGGFISLKNTVFSVADSLVFIIPAKYANNPELLMINNNHIVLGAEMTMASAFMEGEADNESEKDGKAKKITATAIEVTPMTFTADEFAIPAGYTLEVRKPYETSMSDSTMSMMDTAIAVMVDSAAVYVPAKKPAKKPVKKPLKKAPIKSAARKQ